MSLYLVATPIGNLEDISVRAVNTLKSVDLIAAEDTRHSHILLGHYGIKVPCTSFHSYTSDAKVKALTEDLKAGKNMAIITDAGTPGISDPAWMLIKSAVQAGVNLVPIPGAAAFLTALMGSGLPMNEFTYLGFVPVKKGRQTLFQSLLNEDETVILYESPHRLLKTLAQMQEILGPDRTIVIARELTKLHETFHRGTIAELNQFFKKTTPKGEIVLLVAPSNFTFE